jgi:AraC-like DNA-binding protein
MSGAFVIWELLLRGAAIGGLVATGAGLWRSDRQPVRIAGMLFTLSIIGYILNSSPTIHTALGFARIPVNFVALGGAGFFWLFVVTLFEDRPITPMNLAPAGLLTLVGLTGWIGHRHPEDPIWIVHNLIEAGFGANALYVIVQSWRGDLVEARRLLRGPFLGVVTLYVIALSGFEIGEGLGFHPAWYDIAAAGALALLCLGGTIVFLQAQPHLFGAAAGAPPEANAGALDAGDRLLLDKLDTLMDSGEAWRRERLTIGALAEELGAPEHRVRRLINDHLGHRNFASFVNARRIAAAKRLLTDPAKARTPVSAIAFDLGFGSLGPFNRAFKEETGATPSEWRKQALGGASPILENPS